MADLIYTLVVRDDGTAVVKKVTAAVQGIGQAGTQMGEKVAQGARQAKHELTQFERTVERLQRTAAAFLGMWVLTKAMQIPSAAISSAMEFNSQIETSRLGIASILMAQGEFTNSIGSSVEGYEKLIVAQHMSGKLVKQLQLDNLKTIATFDQLVKAFQQTLAPALAKGFNVEQTRQFTTAMVQAAGALGLNLDMLAEETRSMLRGTISPRQTLIATALGITNEDIRRFQGNAGALFEYIMGRLKSFTVAGVESQKTWAGVMSNLKDASKIVLGAGFEDLFKFAKREAQALMNTMVKFNEETGEAELNPEFVDSLKRVGYIIQSLYETFKDILVIIDQLRGPVDLLVEAWRSISISAQAVKSLLPKEGATTATPSIAPWRAPTMAPGTAPKWIEEKVSGKSWFTIGANVLKEFNEFVSGSNKAKQSLDSFDEAMKGHLKEYQNYVVRARELTSDEYEYLFKAASEIGYINDKLKERVTEDAKIKGINIDLETLSGKQLQAAIKTVVEYNKLSDSGQETLEAFTKLLGVRLRLAQIEETEAPLKIVQQIAQATDQYELQKKTIVESNRLSQEKLRLTQQLTPELKRQMDAQTALSTIEIDRAKKLAELERKKDIIGIGQTYAKITGDIEGQVQAMQGLTNIEVDSLKIQIERTKDLSKQQDLWQKIFAIIRLSNKEQEQFKITSAIQQRQPLYTAGLGVAEATGSAKEYQRISKLILEDEIASLRVAQEKNPYLQGIIDLKTKQWEIDSAIKKIEMETYGSNLLAQAASQYAEMTGNIEGQNKALQEILNIQLMRYRVEKDIGKLSDDEFNRLEEYLKKNKELQDQLRGLGKQKEVLGWQKESITLQGSYVEMKNKEIELLENERSALQANNALNKEALSAINTYYDQLVRIAEARKNLDIGELVDIGAERGLIDLTNQLADSYENILPNAVNAAGSAINKFLDNVRNHTMSIGDAFKQLADDFGASIMDMITDIGLLIIKMEILKALGYGEGGGQQKQKTNWGGIVMSVLGAVAGIGGGGVSTGISYAAGPSTAGDYGFSLGGTMGRYQHGGMITEPIWGVGKSGKRYSFGETEPELVTPQSKLGEKSEKESTPINIINVIDPSQMDQWAASAAGQNSIINVIGSNAGKVSRMLK